MFQKSPTDYLKNSGNVAENNITALKFNNIAELLFSIDLKNKCSALYETEKLRPGGSGISSS